VILAAVFGVLLLLVLLFVMAVLWERRHDDERARGEGLVEFLMNLWS
jgi:hypothetical protein